MSETARVLVVAELTDGQPSVLTKETVTAGRRLADSLPADLVVSVLGSPVEPLAERVAGLAGVDRVVAATCDGLEPFLPGPWTGAVAALQDHVRPRVTLIPASITGRDYAARVAARLGIGHVPEATAVSVSEGRIAAVRSVLAGRQETTVTFEPGAPAMLTIAAGAFPQAAPGDTTAPVEIFDIAIADGDRRAELVESMPHAQAGTALATAERIVVGGRGLGGPEHFALVEELSAELDAAVGASGAVVGAGWRPHTDQVGSTGHTVSPRLYVAVGISGAPQHLAGMGSAEQVVAINRDADAPIFAHADFGIVGDLFEVLPAIVAALRNQQGAQG